MQTPPAASAPAADVRPARVDYQCRDGRRVLVLYRPRDAVVRIERYPPIVLTPAGPGAWRSDAYAGGPVVLAREAGGVRLATPGWPDTACLP